MQQMQQRYAGTSATCSTCDTPSSAASVEPKSLAVSFARQRGASQRADRPVGRFRDHVPMVVDSIAGGDSSGSILQRIQHCPSGARLTAHPLNTLLPVLGRTFLCEFLSMTSLLKW